MWNQAFFSLPSETKFLLQFQISLPKRKRGRPPVGTHRPRTLCLGGQKKEWDRNIPDTMIWGPYRSETQIHNTRSLLLASHSACFPCCFFILMVTVLMLWLSYCFWRPEHACVLDASCIPPARSWCHRCCWCNCCCPYCCWLPCSCLCPSSSLGLSRRWARKFFG